MGAFLRSKSLSSYDLCKAQCLLEPECRFWSFDFTLDRDSCKLYSDMLAYTASAVPHETVAGPVACDADGELFQIRASALLRDAREDQQPHRMGHCCSGVQKCATSKLTTSDMMLAKTRLERLSLLVTGVLVGFLKLKH